MSRPLDVDQACCSIAERHGLEVRRRDILEVVDEAAVFAAGYVTRSIDWSKIRRQLAAGIEVPGVVQKAGVEYVLRPREENHAG